MEAATRFVLALVLCQRPRSRPIMEFSLVSILTFTFEQTIASQQSILGVQESTFTFNKMRQSLLQHPLPDDHKAPEQYVQ